MPDLLVMAWLAATECGYGCTLSNRYRLTEAWKESGCLFKSKLLGENAGVS